MRAVTGRSTNVPIIPPIDPNDPNQDTSSNEIGPDASGVSSDFSRGRIGVAHAINIPFDKEIKDAKHCNFVRKGINISQKIVIYQQ